MAPKVDLALRLEAAAFVGNEALVRRLLALGHKPNKQDPDGRSPLFVAVCGQHLGCVKMLLAAGANPSLGDKTGGFPLFYAVQTRNAEIVKALLDARVDIDAVIEANTEGTALLCAVKFRKTAMVKLLIEAGCDLSKRAAEGCPPLSAAARDGFKEIVTMLLDGGADIHGINSDESTALHVATRCRQRDVLRLLIRRGANIDYKGWHGRTALHQCCDDGKVDMMKALIALGADLNLTDDDVATALHLATEFGHLECVRELLRAGAKVSTVNAQGWTPLHQVSLTCRTDIMELLLSGGAEADLHSKDNKERIPLHLASQAQHAKLLDVKTLKMVRPAVAASDSECLKAVNILLEAGSDPNNLDENGRNALFSVLNLEIVKTLLARGASATIVDKWGCSVLNVAGAGGASAAVLCTLYKAGASPILRDPSGHTAADNALQYGHADAAKMLELLAAKHGTPADAPPRPPVRVGERIDEGTVAAVILDKDGRVKVRLADDYHKEKEREKKERLQRAVAKILEKSRKKEEREAAVPEGICLHCDTLTDRRCSKCGNSYFCSQDCEVAARFVCCG